MLKELGKIYICNEKQYIGMYFSITEELYNQIKEEVSKKLKPGINFDLHLHDFIYSVNIYGDKPKEYKFFINLYFNSSIKWTFMTEDIQIFNKEMFKND